MPAPEQREEHFWDVKGLIEKWNSPEDYEAGKPPDDTLEVEDNLLTNAGLTRITSLIVGGGGQAWNNANCRVGVGSGSTGAVATDADLTGPSKRWALMEATYPQTAVGVMTFRGVFDSSEANYAWEEWAIDQGTADGNTVTATMMNHRVTPMGTKVSPAVWTFTVTVTLS